MATLSKDGDDSWHAGGVIRRDFRHTHNGPEVTGGPRKKSKSKRWCKGKEGREHNFTKIKRDGWSYLYRTTTCCANCSKARRDIPLRDRIKAYEVNGDAHFLDKQETLAYRWCQDGHLWDWVPAVRPFSVHEWREELRTRWRGNDEAEECVMCGKRSHKFRPKK